MAGRVSIGDGLTIAILVACYNRAATTLSGIGSLHQAIESWPNVHATFFVIDDASPDRTGEQVKRAFPDVVLEYGSGRLFWNGGMCRAYDLARQHGNFNAYLLFNDDVSVNSEASKQFLDEYRLINADEPAILAAATTSGADGRITYSAMRRTSKVRPLNLERITPNGRIQTCDTFNGNFVMIPGAFFESVGGLDQEYTHSYGDIDLGYVAAKKGVSRYLASVPIGVCKANPPKAGADWGPQDSMQQRSYFVLKHAPLRWALLVVAVSALKRGLHLIRSKMS